MKIRKLIMGMILGVKVGLASEVKCQTSTKMYVELVEEHQFAVNNNMKNKITLTAMNLIDGYDMIKLYCRHEPKSLGAMYIEIHEDYIETIRPMLNK